LNLARRIDGDPTALGSVDAPVVLVEFADYRCPFCGVFARDTMPLLVKEYVDSGQLRIEWRDFPVFGDESVAAAVAGRAAGAQGKFWEFHEVVFANAPERGHPELPKERLIEIAKEIGVADIDRFTADLDNPELAAAVSADQAEAAAIGVTSTPIFVINDTPVSGAQPADVFREIIDAEIARAS
jgi:protein-disulfide isomerase